jgi:FAD/FMN-containing dehydrogenase
MKSAEIEQFKVSLRGELIQPQDQGYDAARKLYNAMIDKKPSVIARCRDVADVIAAIKFAHQKSLSVAIRCGGHNGGGLGSVNDGLVIDLSLMRDVRVDPIARTAQVWGGSLWGDVDHATHAFGLAVPAGVISTTGVGGLTLGGGIGHLTRKYGLTIDNLLSVDVVMADRSYVTADADTNMDLFWAVRGGGGNFGVVTSFTFKLHPVSTVMAGPTFWPLDQSVEVLKWYRGFIPEAPEELNGFFAFLTVPSAPPFPEKLHGKKVAAVVWCYVGSAKDGEKVLAPVHKIGKLLMHGVQPMPYPSLQTAFDPLYPPGQQQYWRADFVKELNDKAIELHARNGARLPTPLSTMHLYPVNGAASRVGKTDTPWAYRDAGWAGVFFGVDPDPAKAKLVKDWAVSYWEDLHPYSMGGAYVNFMMDEGQERVQATYGENYKRLTQIKRKYDPDNFFHINQNIKPAM